VDCVYARKRRKFIHLSASLRVFLPSPLPSAVHSICRWQSPLPARLATATDGRVLGSRHTLIRQSLKINISLTIAKFAKWGLLYLDEPTLPAITRAIIAGYSVCVTRE